MSDKLITAEFEVTEAEKEFVQALLVGIRRSRTLHHWQGKGLEYAVHATYEEANELLCAYYHKEGDKRVKSEALDTCITAAKVCMEEYK